MRRSPHLSVAALAAVLVLAGCGGDDGVAADDGARPRIVATSSIAGDVVAALVGDAAVVEVTMPAGADPHDFQPSARQAQALREADLVVANGAGFEAGMRDVLDAAVDDGVELYELISGVERPLPSDGAGGHDHDHAEEADEGNDHGDEAHDHGDEDPHFFTDPSRTAEAAAALADHLADTVDALGTAEVRERAAAYVAELRALDAEVERLLAPIPPERRRLVTNHEVLGSFADRYGFEVVGAVIPTSSTQGEASAAALADLAATVRALGVPAIFADVASGDRLLQALAAEAGDVEVVGLLTESLAPAGSPGATYVDMVRTNAERIAAALA